MGKHFMIVLMIFSIFLSGSQQNIEDEPIHTLLQIAKTNEFEVLNWEVLIKENLLQSHFEKFLNKFQNNRQNTTKVVQTGIQYYLVFEKTKYIHVEFHPVILDEQAGQIEVTAVIRGTEWNEHVEKEFVAAITYLNENLFHENAKRFACIEVLEDDTIESGVIVEQYTSSLQMIYQNEQKDAFEWSKLNQIIYGYTPLWNEKFVIDGEPYNLQIASVRSETGKASLLIGTPILMNEY